MVVAFDHRGPDEETRIRESSASLAPGFRGLTIIDPSHARHQPMVSPHGRDVVDFNGEAGGQNELRAELPAFKEQRVVALKHLILNAELRRRLGAAGRKRVERWYSLECQAPRLVGMLQALVAKKA